MTRVTADKVEYSTRYFLTSLDYEKVDEFKKRSENIGTLKWIYNGH